MPHDSIHGLKDRISYAVCYTCRKKHLISRDDRINPTAWNDWLLKHPAPGHVTLVIAEARLGELDTFRDNADIKTAYGSSAAYTITLTGLASDANLLAGRESTAVSNTTNLYLDYLIGGIVTTGTTPTDLRTIELWAYGSISDTPLYPDVFDGTDSAETATSRAILSSGCGLLNAVATNNTSDRTYPFAPMSLARLFGGVPKNHGVFVTHSTGVNLNATATNHALHYTPVYSTVA